jgi:CDP-diacylglycerol--glycerol-3-phosphate 3-phosphatidyltransferase
VLTTRFQAWVRRTAMRLMARLQRLPITPNQITVTGLLVTSLAALLVALDHPFLGGLTLLAAGLCDILDGALARASNRSYAYGAFLDSTTDRYAEVVVMLGILIFLQHRGVSWGPTLVLVALAGSLLVSYVRARAQSLGFTCEGGLVARPERVILTVAGLLSVPLHLAGLLIVLWVLAVFTNVTAMQRVWSVWRQARAQRGGAAVEEETATPASEPPVVPPAPPALEKRRGAEPAG